MNQESREADEVGSEYQGFASHHRRRLSRNSTGNQIVSTLIRYAAALAALVTAAGLVIYRLLAGAITALADNYAPVLS